MCINNDPCSALDVQMRSSVGNRRRHIPETGLANLGNTCYMNSTLQCLRHCSAFEETLASSVTSIQNVQNNNKASSLCSTLLSIMSSSPVTSGHIRNFVKELGRVFPRTFYWPHQNDVHEFFELLLDRLDAEVPAAIRVRNKRVTSCSSLLSSSSHKGYVALCKKMDLSWESAGGDVENQGSSVFRGLFVSQVKCGACGACFHNGEVMVSVPVEPDRTVRDGLRAFFAPESIEGWKCDKCGQRGSSTMKSFRLWHPPEILIVLIKRFGVHHKKNSASVYLNEALDLTDNTVIPSGTDNRQRILYDLTSSIHHHGPSANSGHYVATCFCADGRWRQFNDNVVRDCDDSTRPSRRVSRDAYMLVYTRRRGG